MFIQILRLASGTYPTLPSAVLRLANIFCFVNNKLLTKQKTEKNYTIIIPYITSSQKKKKMSNLYSQIRSVRFTCQLNNSFNFLFRVWDRHDFERDNEISNRKHNSWRVNDMDISITSGIITCNFLLRRNEPTEKGDGIKEGFETANAIQFTEHVGLCPSLWPRSSLSAIGRGEMVCSTVLLGSPLFFRALNAPSLIPLSKNMKDDPSRYNVFMTLIYYWAKWK